MLTGRAPRLRSIFSPEVLGPAAMAAAASAAAAAVAPAQAAWERLFGALAAAVERQPGAMREVSTCFGARQHCHADMRCLRR